MSWATQHIAKLQAGETVQFRPSGYSMRGRVEHRSLCTVRPINGDDIKEGDVVLCKVNGRQYLHLVKACSGDRYLIGNNIGKTNGWTGRNSVYGILEKSE